MLFLYFLFVNFSVSKAAVPLYLTHCQTYWIESEMCVVHHYNEVDCFPWATQHCRESDYLVQTHGCPTFDCDVSYKFKMGTSVNDVMPLLTILCHKILPEVVTSLMNDPEMKNDNDHIKWQITLTSDYIKRL